ncbi:MAG: hypothetical protein ABI068_06050, partial [Ktedonobacterales bacterium]
VCMDLEDFLQPEVGIAAAVVAVVASPRLRKFARKGAVFGVAGALIASDAVTSFARGVQQSAKQAAAAAANGANATNGATDQHVTVREETAQSNEQSAGAEGEPVAAGVEGK